MSHTRYDSFMSLFTVCICLFCVNLPSASIQRKLGPHHPAEFVMLAAWVELTNHDSLLDVKVYF